MKKVFIKALSVMLVVVMTLTAAPLSGFVGLELPEWLDFSIMSIAAEPTSGTCGDNLTWVYDTTTYTLTISGTGKMNDYSSSNPPWESYEDSIKKVVINNDVTTIGNYAFYYCTSLTSVTIPDSVITIDKYAFYNCTSLTSITIPDSVITIDKYAFYNCTSLTSITIPESVTSIGDGAFGDCDSLTSITIPDSVTAIGEGAFFACYSLTSITIPDSVTTIGDSAFYSCDSLTDVYYSGTEEQWNKISIGSYNEDLTNATIHYNSTGGGSSPETPEFEKYIGVFTTECSMMVGIKEKFSVGFNLIENGETADKWKKMSIVVSNPDIISVSDYKETGKGFIVDITGKQSGTTNVIVSDTDSGASTVFEVGVYDKEGQIRTYDMKNMPLFQKGLSKTPTNIYDMNGLYVNSFNYETNDDSYNVSFNVYNEYPVFGAVDVYDKDGNWIRCEKIDPCLQVASVWDVLEQSFYLITDVSTGRFLDYTSEFFNNKTEIDIEVPKDGYFNITNNYEASRGVQLYVFAEIFTKAVSKILPAIVEVKDEFIDNLIIAIVDEMIQEEVAETVYSTLLSEAYKLIIKFNVSNVADTTAGLVDIFENFLNALDISWKHIAKMSVGGAEKVLSKVVTSIGTPLKAAFTASDITNMYEMIDGTIASMKYTYASVFTDINNAQNIDGVEVITNGNIEADTILQVFKVFEASAAEKAKGKYYQQYNISFVKNDKTVQPSGMVEVRIPIPKGLKKDTCAVHRQEEDGSWTVLTGRVEGNYLVFETDHFSMYIITGEPDMMSINTLPDKLVYTQGEIFDFTGLILESNGELITEGFTASPSVMGEIGNQTITVFYGEQSVEFDVEVVAPEPEYNYTFYIQEPSRDEIRNKDGIILHARISGTYPEGYYVRWESSNGNFDTDSLGNGRLAVVAEDKGYTTFTAVLYDADGNELTRDSVELYSNSGFFQKIGGFFRSLFGGTKIYEN